MNEWLINVMKNGLKRKVAKIDESNDVKLDELEMVDYF